MTMQHVNIFSSDDFISVEKDIKSDNEQTDWLLIIKH